MSLASGATLSVSYAADLMTLLLLGPESAVIVAVAGAWMQCTFKVKQTYPLYRTAFSMAAEAITMVATGLVFVYARRQTGLNRSRVDRQAARRRDRDILRHQHQPGRRLRFPCRPRARGGRCGTTSSSGLLRASWWLAAPVRSRPWSSSAGSTGRRMLAARACLSDVPNLSHLRRALRRSAAARRGNAASCTRRRLKRCVRR